jgi:hypothetical protein
MKKIWIASHTSFRGEDFIEQMVGIFSSKVRAMEEINKAYPTYTRVEFATKSGDTIWLTLEDRHPGVRITISSYEINAMIEN